MGEEFKAFEPPPVFPEDRWILSVPGSGGKVHRITCSDEEYAHFLNDEVAVIDPIPFRRPPDPPQGQDTEWVQYKGEEQS